MLRAKDIMTADPISVRKNMPIYDAIELMVEHGISGLPIVDDDMTLVGVLSEKDAIRLIFGKENGERKTVSDFMTVPAVHFDKNECLLDVCD
ncbi:MAG: CBS domain-containing protein, partial [Planctomycetota bacterium]